jgi:hypothetical protein
MIFFGRISLILLLSLEVFIRAGLEAHASDARLFSGRLVKVRGRRPRTGSLANDAHKSPLRCSLRLRGSATPSGDFCGNQSVEGKPFCGQIVYEASMKNRNEVRLISFNAWARVRTAAEREKREQEAKILMKQILRAMEKTSE